MTTAKVYIKQLRKQIAVLESKLEDLTDMKGLQYTPIEVAIALSLYGYNVSPLKRAQDLLAVRSPEAVPVYVEEIAEKMVNCGFVPTELSFAWAETYVEQALGRYGKEAAERVACEKRFAG